MNIMKSPATLTARVDKNHGFLLQELMIKGFSGPFSQRKITINKQGELISEMTGEFPGGQQALDAAVVEIQKKVGPSEFDICFSEKEINSSEFLAELKRRKFEIGSETFSENGQVIMPVIFPGDQQKANDEILSIISKMLL
jgi:hypothetical protein